MIASSSSGLQKYIKSFAASVKTRYSAFVDESETMG